MNKKLQAIKDKAISSFNIAKDKCKEIAFTAKETVEVSHPALKVVLAVFFGFLIVDIVMLSLSGILFTLVCASVVIILEYLQQEIVSKDITISLLQAELDGRLVDDSEDEVADSK